MQLHPSTFLEPYIKNYTVVTIETDLHNEVFYPSGYMDLVINLGGAAATIINGRRKETPAIELLGHLTLPTRVAVTKGTVVLIVRFYPFAGALFFSNPLFEFTNYATDLYDIAKGAAGELHDRLLLAHSIKDKMAVLEAYLLQQLSRNEKQLKKVATVEHIYRVCMSSDGFDLPVVARQTGISERYIQQLYLSNVGVNPASFVTVARFNKGLHLMRSTRLSLTEIAYECGYYDQAHFIRSFKKLTGVTPSDARRSLVGNDEAFRQAVNIGF